MRCHLSAATPHTSTPNINAVRHADSRGSLLSTDSGNSLTEKNSEKSSSVDKVQLRPRFFLPFRVNFFTADLLFSQDALSFH